VPVVEVSVLLTVAAPETDGTAVLLGGGPVTCPDTVEKERALVPDAFVAATPTRT